MTHRHMASLAPGDTPVQGGENAPAPRPSSRAIPVAHAKSTFATFALTLLLSLPALLATACSTTLDHGKTQALPAKALTDEARYVETGKVSYYSKVFARKKTASGERYNPEAFTAAHPSLPFGTLLLVKRKKAGRYVIVRVNDRGPHVGGRVLDLSAAAARKLGILTRGVADAEVYVVDPRSRLASQL